MNPLAVESGKPVFSAWTTAKIKLALKEDLIEKAKRGGNKEQCVEGVEGLPVCISIEQRLARLESTVFPDLPHDTAGIEQRLARKMSYSSEDETDVSDSELEDYSETCYQQLSDGKLEVKISGEVKEMNEGATLEQKRADENVLKLAEDHKSTNGSTQGDVNSKRKRGIPIGKGRTEAKRSLRKTIMADSSVGDEAEINTKSDYIMQIAVDDKSNENHFQPSTNDRMKVTADNKHTSGVHKKTDLLGKTAIIPLPEDQASETVPSKRVRRPKNSQSSEHEGMNKLVDKCQNASQGNTSLPEIYHVKDVNMLMDGILGYLNDDQLSNSTFQVDKPSSMGSDASRTLPVQRHCAHANGRQDDFGTSPAAKKDRIDSTDGPTPGDLPVKNLNQAGENGELRTPAKVSINMENDQSLPFTKCSPLWKAIECSEIYKSMEQRPHFSPLIKCHEESREGFAIAHMVNFSNLVEKTRTLQFSHPITVIESSLETLVELESNGFDVETIRACLTQLLSKKQMGEELQMKYQDIESEISNTFNQKQKVDEEINQLDEKMNELVARLGDAKNRKEMKERVIATLKSKQGVVRQNVQGLELEFQNIAGSLR